MKLDFFIRIPMEEEYDFNAQFLCIILKEKEVLFQKMLYLPPIFCVIWAVLKIISNQYFEPLFHTCHQVQLKKSLTKQNRKDSLLEKLATLSWMTKPQKRRTDLFSIFAAFSRMIKTQKRRTSDWRKWFHYIKWQKHKIRAHCCLQKLTPF